MKTRDLGRLRLMNLQLATARRGSAAETVAALGALQAQDYAGGLWAIGLRMPGAVLADVERAIANRTIVRSWPLRGTLHIVAATDLGWLLDLLGPRVIAASTQRSEALALDDATFRKVGELLARALEGGVQLTRDAIRALLEQAQISTHAGRLYHCLWRLSLEQLLCFGVPVGKQPTFTLLREWLPAPRRLERDEALATLALRYFCGHGPATARDLMRWAGLSSAEAKLGIGAAAKQLTRAELGGTAYWLPADQPAPSAAARGTFLLPGFDEFILGYGDRAAILDPAHASKIVPGSNGIFRPTIVHDGQVIGTWQAATTKRSVKLRATGFEALSEPRRRSIARAAARYGAFLGKPTTLSEP